MLKIFKYWKPGGKHGFEEKYILSYDLTSMFLKSNRKNSILKMWDLFFENPTVKILKKAITSICY